MNPLVQSHIYEGFVAPKVHILLARPWGFPICSSLKITPLATDSYKTHECDGRQSPVNPDDWLVCFGGVVLAALVWLLGLRCVLFEADGRARSVPGIRSSCF